MIFLYQKTLTVLNVVGLMKLRENSFKSCNRNRKRAYILNVFLWQGFYDLVEEEGAENNIWMCKS